MYTCRKDKNCFTPVLSTSACFAFTRGQGCDRAYVNDENKKGACKRLMLSSLERFVFINVHTYLDVNKEENSIS